jgi:CheY-like chemotaxis protein
MLSVLLVDDSFALREALARSLARRGCRVTTAASGLEAYELLRNTTVDVVVTDLNMPPRDGLWLWRQALLEWPELRGHFVLIASEPLRQPASLAPFNTTERFLLKPLAIDELWTAVQDAAPPSLGGRRRFQPYILFGLKDREPCPTGAASGPPGRVEAHRNTRTP